MNLKELESHLEMNASFDYILQVNAIRQAILKKHPERPPPSWVRITTITMCSKFLQEIDLQKFKENFAKLGSVTVRRSPTAACAGAIASSARRSGASSACSAPSAW